MSAPVLDRPPARPSAPEVSAPEQPSGPSSHEAALLAVIGLLLAACLPLTRVYVGLSVLRPIVAAVLLSVGLAWVCRRLGWGPLTGLVVSALGWAVFSGVVFLSDTLHLGVVPSLETFAAGRDLWLRGVELVRIRPAPALPEAGLVFMTVTGVWWIAHAVEGLVFRLHAPLRATAMALLLWLVPLAIAPPGGRPWVWAVPFLGGAALLLLVAGSADRQRWSAPRRTGDPLAPAGTLVAAAAIVAGAVLGGLLPGFEDPPYYEVRSLGGTTITTNPIVSIRSSLVNLSDRHVADVTSPEPVYLRLTALDLYSDLEEWTSDGIRGSQASGRLPFETETPVSRELTVDVAVADLTGAIIVPAPYHPVRVDGELARSFQFDRQRATLTLGGDASLSRGDRFTVESAVPAPAGEALVGASVAGADPALTALPASVPQEVAELARQVVEAAGAVTPFEQALAIQGELRSWTYSLDPPRGHGSSAMRSFITNRIGYCEQYAGTMAVMLRTLGIPSRVAVGFTPGALVNPAAQQAGAVATAGQYRITHANAHAWVEVLFPGHGWIAFEPTPRTDGNVLVPSPGDPAPALTEAQEAQQEPITEAPPDDGDFIPRPDEPEREGPAQMDDAGTAPGGGDDPDGGAPLGLLALLLVVLALAGGGLVLRSRRGGHALVPADRVLHELERIRRLARGLGITTSDADTDRELLRRIAGDRDAGEALAGEALAGAAERARYALTVPAEDARVARAAAAALERQLLAGRSWAARTVIRIRGPLAAAVSATWRTATRSPSAGWSSSGTALRRLIRRRTARGHG